MAFRREFVLSVGGFPEELDAGMPTESGGDTYLIYRVLRAGFRVVYEPRAMAFHHHRNDLRALEHVIRGYGTGVCSYLVHAVLSDRDPQAALAGAWYAWDRLIRQSARRLAQRPQAVPARLLAAEATGIVRTVRAYPAARRIVAGRPRVAIDWDAPIRLSPPPAALDSPPANVSGNIRDLPSLSVVIPTRGRRDQVVRLLRALDEQVYDDRRVQFVVAIDGDIDGTAEAVAALSPRRRVDLVVLCPPDAAHGFGAAAARNAGVAEATGDVLVFLDDDVTPVGDSVLVAHAARHRDGERPMAVVGPCPPARWDVSDGHGAGVRNWWVDQVRVLTEGRALGFADVLTGNLSLRRILFDEVGGFRPLARREDWDLGYRLMQRGVDVCAAPEAVVMHDADLDLRSALADRRSEGAGDVALAAAHAGLGRLLPLMAAQRVGGRMQFVVRRLLRAPHALDGWLAVLPTWLELLDRMGLREGWAREHGRAMMIAYWAGVAGAVSGEAGLMALLAPVPLDATKVPVVDLGDLWGSTPEVLPVGGTAVEVVLRGELVGEAPLSLGGIPWQRTTFQRRLVESFAHAALGAWARRAIP
jgi:GT2 family glycosyltransferase